MDIDGDAAAQEGEGDEMAESRVSLETSENILPAVAKVRCHMSC